VAAAKKSGNEMEISELLSVGTIIALFSLAYTMWKDYKQSKLDQKLRTLEYATGQFDGLRSAGSRYEMSKLGAQNILDYIGDDKEKKQKFLEYAYVCNRIGLGIYKGALSEDIIFNIWTPSWFEGTWKKLMPLVSRERKERKEQAKGAYVFFDWLAKEKCPQVREKYPEKSATTET